MNWMQFLASLVSSLAWPVATIVILVVFKDSLVKHIPTLSKLKAGSVEAEFKRELGQATDSAREYVAASIEQTAPADVLAGPGVEQQSSSANLLELIDIQDDPRALRANPNGVVMEAWAAVEKLLRTRHALTKERSEPVRLFAQVVAELYSERQLNDNDMNSILKLQAARDIAAHSTESITEDSAEHFAKLASSVSNRLKKRWRDMAVSKK